MKKILIMALAGFSFFSAEAQTRTTIVCSAKSKGTACYQTKYAENFPVCESNGGYYICGEVPTKSNSTIKNINTSANFVSNMYEPVSTDNINNTPSAMLAPQSQSYPIFNINSQNAYEGYYPKKNYIKVSYDNVADDNLAPYEGLPSPQYDGPEKNAERNINANNPNAHLAPITGRRE